MDEISTVSDWTKKNLADIFRSQVEKTTNFEGGFPSASTTLALFTLKSTLMNRCPRCLKDQLYIDYHDQERGVPVKDDRKQFEFLTLESAQAGLSRYTVLKKRDAYREAFANRDPQVVATYDEAKIEELMSNAGIIRNRAKINAAITNARVFLEIQKEFGSFCNYIRGFTDGNVVNNQLNEMKDCPSTSAISDAVSADLKKRGMKFVGSTIIYAHLQATGQINDHLISCFRH